MEAAGTTGAAAAAAAAPAFSSPDIEAAVRLAIGPAVHAAVQATMAATAAAGGPGGVAGVAAVAGGSEAFKPVVEALQEVTQAVRSTEGQLVKAVQDSTQQLLARMDAHALAAYNVAVDAHNQKQLAKGYEARLLPRKNSAGELPPAGVFPSTVRDLDDMARRVGYYENIEERNARLVKLYRFYGTQASGKPWPAEEALPAAQHKAVEEYSTRAGYLRTFLRLW